MQYKEQIIQESATEKYGKSKKIKCILVDEAVILKEKKKGEKQCYEYQNV